MNNRLLLYLWTFIALLLSVGSCSGDGATAPRPKAYPRIAVCDSVYVPLDTMGRHLEFNAGAHVSVDSVGKGGLPLWLTADYPLYKNVHIYITISSYGADVLANRRERMALNAGDADGVLTELCNPYGFSSEVLLTRYGSMTPVQFIAGSNEVIVSGACYVEGAAECPDSVMPVVDALYADVIHLSKTLR